MRCLFGLAWAILPLLVALVAQASSVPSVIQVDLDLSQQLFINGVSELRREAYFNIHSSRGSFTDAEADLLFNQWHATLGRDVGRISWLMRQVPSDPHHPGYPDLAALARLARRKAWDKGADPLESDMVDGTLPETVYPDLQKPLKPGRFVPANHMAAAEALDGIFKALGSSRPRYFEVMNECNVHAHELHTTFADMCDLHVAVARKLHPDFPNLLVGGPALAYPEFEAKDFAVWRTGMGMFIQRAGTDMDFFSLHLYNTWFDWFGGKVNERVGANTEAILDLVQNQSLLSLGMIKPIVISEYGGGFKKGSQLRKTYSPARDWLVLKSVNGFLFTFFNRPAGVIKSIPFIVAKATWFKSDHPYPWVLYHKVDGQWQMTYLAKWYEFWKDVSGVRVPVSSSSANVQVQGFVNGCTVYLCLNNLNENETYVKLNPGGANFPASATISRLFLNGDAPAIENETLKGEIALTLRANECVIVRWKLADAPAFTKRLDERTTFGNQTVVPIQGRLISFTLPAGLTVGKPVSARLRVGFGRSGKLSLTPHISFNGHRLNSTLTECGNGNPDDPNWFGDREVGVPVEWLKAVNHVTVSFPDSGGRVSSLALVIGTESSLTASKP